METRAHIYLFFYLPSTSKEVTCSRSNAQGAPFPKFPQIQRVTRNFHFLWHPREQQITQLRQLQK